MANIVTELNIVDPNLKGGRKLDVEALKISNHRLHLIGTQLSKMMVAMIEGDSNNSSATLVPQEVRSHWMQMDAIKSEYAFALAHNDGPLIKVEENLMILVPTGKEIQLTRNEKCKRVVKEIKRLAQVIVSLDSAGLQAVIGEGSKGPFETQLKTVEDAMLLYMGKGKDITDTGMEMPEYAHVGTMIPDLDADYSELQEASADDTETGYSDVKDTPSKTSTK